MTQEILNQLAKGKIEITIDRKSSIGHRHIKTYMLYTNALTGDVLFANYDTTHMLQVLSNPHCDCQYKFT